MEQLVIIFVHGFGVRSDSKGMFTECAAALAPAVTVLFDLCTVREDGTEVLEPFSVQADKLQSKVLSARTANPEARIALIAHSQGCIISGLAQTDAEKIILLAPPFSIENERTIARLKERAGTHVDTHGVTTVVRKDGSVIVIPKEYWEERATTKPRMLYERMAQKSDMVMVRALHDELLTQEGGGVDGVREVWLEADHNFTGEARDALVQVIRQELEL